MKAIPDWLQCSFEVTDEAGTVVLRLSLSEAIKSLQLQAASLYPVGQQQQSPEAAVADEGVSSFPLGSLPCLARAKLWGGVFLAPHKARYKTRAFHRCMLLQQRLNGSP
jgi:hypothetical protein